MHKACKAQLQEQQPGGRAAHHTPVYVLHYHIDPHHEVEEKELELVVQARQIWEFWQRELAALYTFAKARGGKMRARWNSSELLVPRLDLITKCFVAFFVKLLRFRIDAAHDFACF